MIKLRYPCRALGVHSAFWLVVFALLLPVSGSAFADPRPPVARPEMPAHFDRETVQRLLAEVDQNHNAAILKVGYFMRRGKVDLPQSEGLEMLKAAVNAETAGTKRWFVLQSLYGMACLRVPGASPQDGLAAYAALFDRAADAQKAGASYQLISAINEYTFSVIGRMNDLRLRSDPQAQEALLKAWMAYILYVGQLPPGQSVAREPDWSRAIIKTNAQEQFIPSIEKVLNDKATPKTYGVLKACASVLEAEKPQRALELLQQAKPLVPRDDLNEVAHFYKKLVDLLLQTKQLPAAITAQAEFSKQTGRGQARLAILYLQNKDQAAADAVLQNLLTEDANEREINELGEALQDLAFDEQQPDTKAAERAVKLLQNYLSMPRERNVEQELRARKTLGVILLNQKKYPEALAALDIGHLKPPFPTPRARSYETAIKRLRAAAEELVKS